MIEFDLGKINKENDQAIAFCITPKMEQVFQSMGFFVIEKFEKDSVFVSILRRDPKKVSRLEDFSLQLSTSKD